MDLVAKYLPECQCADGTCRIHSIVHRRQTLNSALQAKRRGAVSPEAYAAWHAKYARKSGWQTQNQKKPLL